MLTPGTVTDLTGFFRADQICTSLASAVTVELTESPEAAYSRLQSASFDQAPVTRAGRLAGWIATEALARHEPVESCMTALEDCTLVSAESSIAGILPLLANRKFLFVVGAGEMLGFIVLSDLDRHAVRSYVYLLIAGIEMQLAEIVRKACKPDDIEEKIRGPLAKVYNEACSKGQETNPVEYLNLKGLMELFQGAECDDHLLCDERLSDLLGRIAKYRNDVMHANKSLAASADAASIGDLPSWATEASASLGQIISSIAPVA